MFSSFRSPGQNKSKDEEVPDMFVKIVKCALAKLVGAGYLDVEYINRDFWKWFPKKMSNSKSYLKNKDKVKLRYSFLSHYYFFSACNY